MPAAEQITQTRRLSLALYALLCVAIVTLGVSSYRGYEETTREQVRERLSAIAALKVTEISAWRTERIEDGRLLQRTPGFSALALKVLRGEDGASRDQLTAWFADIQATLEYTQVSLIDATGNRLMSWPAASRTVDAGASTEAERAMASGEVSIADFHRDETPDAKVHLSVVVPVVDPATGESVGVVALKVDPSVFLYPYIKQWPGDSASAETLLVERSGNDVVFLNDLRFRDNAALNMRFPLTATNIPAVQVALGHEVVMDGVDYRGVKVVAATRKVPESPWGVVARVDASEVYAPMRTRLRTTVILGSLAMLAGLFGTLVVLRLQALRVEREHMEAEAERAWLASAIDQSLNEVYVFDAETLEFEYANAGALKNTGYSMEELSAMTPIDIKSEFTPESFTPLLAPLRTGELPVYVFETVHRRKDGTTYPVEVHLQLANRSAKQVFLALISDISERRVAEEKIRLYQAELETLVAERTEQLQDTNEELAATNEELISSNEELSSVNEELAALNEEFEASNEELHTLYSEAAESGQELERLNRALSQADSAKSDFLASMSHELRTPLNSVIGFSDIMLQGLAGELNAEQQRQMVMINGSGKHLLALINDVLDLSKIEAGRMESDATPFDLCSVLSEVVESVRPQAVALGLALNVECRAPYLSVVSDERMVKQVLFNLLSNAIKFTDEGSVTVRLSLGGDTVHISVADTGPGIASADLQRIFDEFTQVRTGDRRPEGTGLGLAVSSRLAVLLGGKLTVESVVGEGSTFTLSVPVQPRSAEAD